MNNPVLIKDINMKNPVSIEDIIDSNTNKEADPILPVV